MSKMKKTNNFESWILSFLTLYDFFSFSLQQRPRSKIQLRLPLPKKTATSVSETVVPNHVTAMVVKILAPAQALLQLLAIVMVVLLTHGLKLLQRVKPTQLKWKTCIIHKPPLCDLQIWLPKTWQQLPEEVCSLPNFPSNMQSKQCIGTAMTKMLGY